MNNLCILLNFSVILVTLLLVVSIPGTKIDRYDTAIKECEQNLPRNQRCKIIAIIDDTKHD